jgi:uncharacterized Zn-binding protein involved in type VI secretion
MPAIARRTDFTRCLAHTEGEITGGDGTVFVCFEPVAREGDEIKCRDGSKDVILPGEGTVWMGGKPVACKGDRTAHGGVIATGCPRVLVGKGLRGKCKRAAADDGSTFIQYSIKRKRAPFLNPTAK